VNVWTKICGVTRSEDAIAAARAGADAIGVNFCAPSPRFCSAAAAEDIVRAVAGALDVYGVFAGETADGIAATVKRVGLTGVQLHGGEDVAFLRQVRALVGAEIRMIRVVPVASRATVAAALAAASDHRVLIDSPRGGGSGTGFDTDLVAGLDLSEAIAAGGLAPHNVGTTVARLRPYGVDVASGVESAPGVKDHAKIREFIEHAKRSAA
jgi:phosphoribosylanthranilate isomerase